MRDAGRRAGVRPTRDPLAEHRAEWRRCGLWDGGGPRVPAQARAAGCYGRDFAGLVCYLTVWDMALVPRAR